MAIGSLAALAIAFGLHVYRWHLPYRVEGIAGEWPLLAATLAAGMVAALVLPRVSRRFAATRLAAGSVAALVAFLILAGADPFAGARSWRYAPAGCNFAVEFPRRAEIVAGEVRLAGVSPQTVTRAVYTAVGDARSLSAECLAFARAVAASARGDALNAAEAQLRAAAARLRLKIERVTRDGDTVTLAGFSDEGRTAANAPLLRHAEARALLGTSSLLVLWAWKLGNGNGDAAARAFFATAQPARKAQAR